MQIIRSTKELQPAPKRVCLAIGFFDGVHLGHQQIIRQTVADAELHEAAAVVITFDRHPKTIVAPDRVPALVYSLNQKLKAIASVGPDATLLIHFNQEFSLQSGEEFIRTLHRDFGHIQSICVGSSFTFGHKRSGNVPLLQDLGRELKFTVHGLAALALDGYVVSSTRIRDAITAGKLDLVAEMLGRPYSLAGEVMKGDQLGSKLGFPTANLDCAGRVMPPVGVYTAHTHVDGRTFRVVLNIGVRPTIASSAPRLRVEAHLLDFAGDLYGRELELTFVQKLRDELKFPSLDALKRQITADVARANQLFDEA